MHLFTAHVAEVRESLPGEGQSCGQPYLGSVGLYCQGDLVGMQYAQGEEGSVLIIVIKQYLWLFLGVQEAL